MNLGRHEHSVHSIYHASDTVLGAFYAFSLLFFKRHNRTHEVDTIITSISQECKPRLRGVKYLALNQIAVK